MLNPTVASGFKLLPFLRPASGESAALLTEARRLRPVLVESKPKAGMPGLTPTAALAHDARNALTSLQLLSGLLGEPGVLQPGHAHLASDLLAIGQTLNELISSFENLGRKSKKPLETGDKGHTRSAGDAVKDCARLLQTIAGSKTMVHVSSESNLPPLRIGPDALSRVLTNLVKNASEAMPDGGTVRILVRRALSLTSPAVLIHVSDDGPGIPAHALGQVFQPGFSSKQGIPEACGLGLAIVKQLVEAAGGKVRVASTRRRGTTFELRLPCLTKGQ